MQRLFSFSYQYAWQVLLLLATLTGLSMWLLPRLTIDVSTDTLIPADSPLKLQYQRSVDAFGSDQIAIIYVEDAELFTYAKLETLRQLGRELKALPQVQRVESIFTVSNVSGGFGYVDTSPIFQTIPRSQDKIDERKTRALANPLLVGQVIADDGSAMALTLYLNPGEPDAKGYERELYHTIEAMLEEHTFVYDRIFQVGQPAVQTWMEDYILADQVFLLPLACLILLTIIGVLLRSTQCALLTFINAAMATLWTAGMMAALGIPVSMLNSIVPALILIIGATEDVHILSEYKHIRSLNFEGKAAVVEIAREIGLTLLLTGITTIFGFAVTGINSMSIMQDFAVVAAFAMFSRLIVSATCIPAWLRYLGRYIKPSSSSTSEITHAFEESSRESRFIMERFIAKPYRAIIAFALIALPCAIMIPRINVSNDMMSFLQADSPVREKVATVSDKLSGTKTINLTIYGDVDTLKTAKKLQQLDRIVTWLRQDERIDSAITFSDHISLVNQAMFGGGEDMLTVPDRDALIAQYLLFFHRSQLKPYVNGNYSAANISIRTSLDDTTAFNELVESIQAELDAETFGLVSYALTGKSVLVASAVDNIIIGQTVSLSSIVVILFIIVGVLFLSYKAAVMAVLANLFPVAVIFGIMALLEIPLNVGTCMVAAITIGIAVDDTLHLMSRYNKLLRHTADERKAIEIAIVAEFRPVLVTTMSLASGFFVLGFSSFVPIQQFGLLSCFVMLLALIADLILTPVLLSTIRLVTLWDVLGFKLRERLMEQSDIFRGMSSWQTKKLILLATLEHQPKGKVIMREGDMGDRMYVLIDGEMTVSRDIAGETTQLATLQPGDVLGEIALVARIKRTADVTCSSDCQLLALDWEALERLQRTTPKLSSKLFLNLSRILGLRVYDSNRLMEQVRDG